MSNYPPPPGPNDPGGQDPYNQPPPPQGGGYGSMPSMSGGSMQPAANAPQPQSIALAVKLMYVGAVLSLLGVITTLFMKDQMRASAKAALDAQKKVPDAATLNAAVNVGMATGIIIGLIGVAVWIWMAKANGSGKSWARIVATVLGVLNIIFTLIGFTSSTGTGLSKIVSVISLLLAIAILVLLWRKESSSFYAAHAAPAR